jgi:rubrerythrin
MVGQSTDTAKATIGTLLKMAIQLEAAAERFYEGLAERFSHCPEVAEFWRVMSAEEACHKNRLTEWGALLDAKRLSQPIDPKMLRASEKLLATNVEELLDEAGNLDDAYQTAHDLESSEMNAIFRFFIKEFAQDRRVVAALRHDLDEHAERLMAGFPIAYSTQEARARVLSLRAQASTVQARR